MLKLLSVLSVFFAGANTFIVPGELPTILSLVYSNIPAIKKGTDSRLGWGFRLGDRADFQFLVELGPQTYTQPLGNQQQNSNSKRNTIDNLSNVLYAQRQHEKAHFSNTDGGNWLKQWSKTMGVPQGRQPTPQFVESPTENEVIKPNREEESDPVLGIGEIDAKLVIPEDGDLTDLKNLQTEKSIASTTTKIIPETTTSKKDALDNVEIDD